METKSQDLIQWEVLNPVAITENALHMGAPRLPDLNRRKIGLFWNGKPDGNVLLDAISKLLRQQFNDIDLINFNLRISVGTENIKLMAESCDGIIAAIGD
jgi:hypothetical protein